MSHRTLSTRQRSRADSGYKRDSGMGDPNTPRLTSRNRCSLSSNCRVRRFQQDVVSAFARLLTPTHFAAASAFLEFDANRAGDGIGRPDGPVSAL